MVLGVIGEQIQIIAYITIKNKYNSIFQLSFQLKSNSINIKVLIVSDCSPFEAKQIWQGNELRIPSDARWIRFDGENGHDGQSW